MRTMKLGDRMFSLREYEYLGTYEGGLLIDPLVGSSVLWETEDGDVETTGHYALLRGPLTDDDITTGLAELIEPPKLTTDEREFLKTMAGAIVYTNSQGFVDVVYYATDAELQRMWEQVTQDVEDFYASADAEAYNETKEG